MKTPDEAFKEWVAQPHVAKMFGELAETNREIVRQYWHSGYLYAQLELQKWLLVGTVRASKEVEAG